MFPYYFSNVEYAESLPPQVDVVGGSVAKEFDELWNPVSSGLPEDITLELNTPDAGSPPVTPPPLLPTLPFTHPPLLFLLVLLFVQA